MTWDQSVVSLKQEPLLVEPLAFRKPSVLSPLCFLGSCVRNEVDLSPLACEDEPSGAFGHETINPSGQFLL